MEKNYLFYQQEYNIIHSGEVDNDINFTYETNTEVYASCAALLDDEMWILGGYSKKRPVNLQWIDYKAEFFNIQMLTENKNLKS